ncbi:MAG: BACON domain-containing protein, partial [Limisphaerales bacterium]
MAKMKTVFLTLAILFLPALIALATEVNHQTNPDHHPKLVVTPANLNFFTCSSEGLPAPAPTSQTLQIRGVPNPRVHEGVGDRSQKDSLEWTASPSAAWVHIEPASGFSPDEPAVTVDPSGLAVGEHGGSIRFDTPGQEKPRYVQIKFRIQTSQDPPPILLLSEHIIIFTGEAFSNITLIDSVNVDVAGAPNVEFKATNSQSWLKTAPSEATTPSTVLLLASTDSLAPGTYYDTVVFKARISFEEGDGFCGSDEISNYLPVVLTLTPGGEPALVVSPRRLGFAALFGGPEPFPQTLLISAQGGTDIPWSTTHSQTWLKVNPANGTAVTAPSQVAIATDIEQLNPGLYTDTITFSSSMAGISDTKVPVFLQIFPPSELTDSVAIGDGVVDLTDPQVNRFSVPIFASNTQAVRAFALPLHFADGQTNLDSVTFAGGRIEFADLKLFLRLSEPGDFLVLIGFVLAPALPPGEGTIGWLHFTTTGVLPQFADTLIIDSTSVSNATGDPNMPQSLSVSYLVFSGGNPLILNPAFKKGAVILRNAQIPT